MLAPDLTLTAPPGPTAEELAKAEAEAAQLRLSSEQERARAARKALTVALKVANVAAGALATLAKKHIVNQITITEEGGIPPLIELLKKSNSGAHENATKALWHLAETEDNQSAIAKAGGIAPLVVPGGLASAAAALARARRVGIITGFPCLITEEGEVRFDSPQETDGPPGAVAIAKALLALDDATEVVSAAPVTAHSNTTSAPAGPLNSVAIAES